MFDLDLWHRYPLLMSGVVAIGLGLDRVISDRFRFPPAVVGLGFLLVSAGSAMAAVPSVTDFVDESSPCEICREAASNAALNVCREGPDFPACMSDLYPVFVDVYCAVECQFLSCLKESKP